MTLAAAALPLGGPWRRVHTRVETPEDERIAAWPWWLRAMRFSADAAQSMVVSLDTDERTSCEARGETGSRW